MSPGTYAETDADREFTQLGSGSLHVMPHGLFREYFDAISFVMRCVNYSSMLPALGKMGLPRY
jgi:hypothetical protein